MHQGSEARGAERLPRLIPVVLRTDEAGDARLGMTLNISPAGICLVSGQALAPGASVSLRLDGRLDMLAQVVWCRPQGSRQVAGLRFELVTASQQSQMHELVNLRRTPEIARVPARKVSLREPRLPAVR